MKIPSKILLIGVTGFTGRHLIKVIQAHNRAAREANKKTYDVTLFVRPGKEVPPQWKQEFQIIRGTLEDKEALEVALSGQKAVICLASLGFGHGPSLVDILEQAAIKRAVFVSTTAIFTKLNAASKKIRRAAEAEIIQSQLSWTILRPTMIYGRKGDRNMERLVRYLMRWSVVFVPGSAKAKQQPVHVEDVATALWQAYLSPHTCCKAYNISGAEPLSFKDVVEGIGAALGHTRRVVEIPLKPCLYLLKLYEKLCVCLHKNPRLKAEQVLRLNENKTFDHTAAAEDFGYAPMDFFEGVTLLMNDMNAKN